MNDTLDAAPADSPAGGVVDRQGPDERVWPIEVHDLSVAYQRRPVLWGVDLQIPAGTLVGVIGPNGAGKSTLIKAILDLVPTVGGYVRIFGESYRSMRRRVGYVPQRTSVDWDFPVSVLDVVLMGLYGRLGLLRGPGRTERQQAMEALERVGMAAYAKRQISELSGGQQQRTFLARALVQNCDIYLMDEPFVGVDAATEAAIVEILRTMRAQGRTVVVVNHDLHTAREYFDQLILLNMRVVAYGATTHVFTPELLQKTYGGRLTIMSAVVQDLVRREE